MKRDQHKIVNNQNLRKQETDKKILEWTQPSKRRKTKSILTWDLHVLRRDMKIIERSYDVNNQNH